MSMRTHAAPPIPLLFLLLLLPLSLLLLFLTPPTSAQPSPTDVSSVSILSVSGCTDVGPRTTNCTAPSRITLTVSGLPSGYPAAGAPNVLLLGDGVDVLLSTFYVSNTTLECNVRLQGYLAGLFTVPLSLVLWDYRTSTFSAAFQGVELAYLAPPVITGVGGCEGSGTATLRCEPALDVLQVYGTGLLTLSAISYQIVIGGSYSFSFSPGTGLQPVSDTLALLPLNSTYDTVVELEHYGGAEVPFFLTLGSWSYLTSMWQTVETTPFNLSFIPLPPPQVSSAVGTGGGCMPGVDGDNRTVTYNCFAQVSFLRILGHYMYGVNVSIGAADIGYFPCRGSASPSPTDDTWRLPLIPGITPGRLLDVVLSNPQGSVTIPQTIAYTAQVSLTSIDPCQNPGWNSAGIVQCTPGSLINLRGQNFIRDVNTVVSLRSRSTMGQPQQVNCTAPAFQTSNLITCTLPVLSDVLAAVFYGQNVDVQLYFPTSGNYSSILPPTMVYGYPDQPVISSIRSSGCASFDQTSSVTGLVVLRVSLCQPEAVLTLLGVNFNLSQYSVNTLTNTFFNCQTLPGWNATYATCQFRYWDEDTFPLTVGVYIPFTMNMLSPRWSTSNGFQVSFTTDGAPSPVFPHPASMSGSAVDVKAVLAGVLSAVGFVAMVAVAVLMWRRMRAVKTPSPRSSDRRDGDDGRLRMGQASDRYQGDVEL